MFDEDRRLYVLAPVAILGCLQVTSQKPWRNVIWMFFWPVSFGCENFFWRWLFTWYPRAFALEYGCNSPWCKEDWLLNGENRINGGFLMTRQLVPESRTMSDVWHVWSMVMKSMWVYNIKQNFSCWIHKSKCLPTTCPFVCGQLLLPCTQFKFRAIGGFRVECLTGCRNSEWSQNLFQDAFLDGTHLRTCSSMPAKCMWNFTNLLSLTYIYYKIGGSDRNSALYDFILSELQPVEIVSGYLSSSCHWARRLA